MGADPARIYLRVYLINLALLVKDAKRSYSIVVKETNSIKLLRNNHPSIDDRYGLKRYNKKMTNHLSKRRIALMSFAGSCGIVSNILWPNIRKPKCNGHITKLDRRKTERKEYLKNMFPQSCFPYLKKNFRNFLMHSDEKLDDWSLRTKHYNMAFNTTEDMIILPKNMTYWINISPSNYVVTYYEEGRYQNVDIRMMYRDILKLPPLIPKALDNIMGDRIDWHYQMVKSLIE